MAASIIQVHGNSPRRTIALDSRDAHPIDNCQCFDDVTHFSTNLDDMNAKNYRPIAARTPIITIYNCHGMTFASRRSGIDKTQTLIDILAQDKYDEVKSDEILEGDVVLYYGPSGDIEHSAIVLSKPESLGIPIVVSKWGYGGKEYIHYANKCPYDFSGAKYYRIKS